MGGLCGYGNGETQKRKHKVKKIIDKNIAIIRK